MPAGADCTQALTREVEKAVIPVESPAGSSSPPGSKESSDEADACDQALSWVERDG